MALIHSGLLSICAFAYATVFISTLSIVQYATKIVNQYHQFEIHQTVCILQSFHSSLKYIIETEYPTGKLYQQSQSTHDVKDHN